MLRVLAGAYAPCLFGCELCLLCLRALVCFAARPSPARVQRMHLAVANSPHSATAHAATAASSSGEFRRTLVGDEDEDDDGDDDDDAAAAAFASRSISPGPAALSEAETRFHVHAAEAASPEAPG